MVCANAAGEKEGLWVIGKFLKPRCFPNSRSLPCRYTAQTKSWMTSDQFVSWVRELDQKFRGEERKVCLLIDNCPAHPPRVDGLHAVEIKFLPPNTSSKLQPMDQVVDLFNK